MIVCGIRLLVCLLLTSSVLVLSGCQTMSGRSLGPNATAGSVIGGASGGLIGAAVGATEGKTTEGALIGALAGATAGGVLGNLEDQEIEGYERQQLATAQAAQAGAITKEQVIAMSRTGLGDDIIRNQISARGIAQRLNTNDLIMLKNNGVSDSVIGEMQSAELAVNLNLRPAQVVPVVPVPPVTPVIYAPFPARRLHCPPPPRRRGGTHFSVRF